MIQLLTGTHPGYLPKPLRLPGRSLGYDEFVLAMPEQLAFCQHHQTRSLHSKASISEPVTWEPPFDWVTGIPWPGPDPHGIRPEDLHPLIRAGLPVRAIAARLGTTADHARLAATRHPAPSSHPVAAPHRLRPSRHHPPQTSSATSPDRDTARARSPASPDAASAPSGSSSPALGSARRPSAQTAASTRTGCASSTRTASAASRTSPPRPTARSRPSPLRPARPGTASGTASAAGHTPSPPSADPCVPPDVWTVFGRPGAEQRIRRFLTLPGQPGLNHAARQLSIRNAVLTSQVTLVGTTRNGASAPGPTPHGGLVTTAWCCPDRDHSGDEVRLAAVHDDLGRRDVDALGARRLQLGSAVLELDQFEDSLSDARAARQRHETARGVAVR